MRKGRSAVQWTLACAIGIASGPSAACGGSEVGRARLPSLSPASAPAVAAPAGATRGPAAPTAAEASAFVADVEAHLRALWVERDRANWISENFITSDTEALAASGEEATAAYIGEVVPQSRRFDAIRADLPADVTRKLYLLSVSQTVPAPADPARRKELARIETAMTSAYGKAQYCPPPGSPLLKYGTPKSAPSPDSQPGAPANATRVCLRLDELSHVLATSRSGPELDEAWRGWHGAFAPWRAEYARYVELANEGARAIGFADVGALWRAGYDMPPAAFEADVARLWSEVKPLYDALHCFVRGKLQARYGKARVPDGAPIPSDLLGNMWAQEWNNIYDLVAPYPEEPPFDVTRAIKAAKWDARTMVQKGEHFFTSLGFAPLPATFWERSLFTRPRDREVVCHASAWDVGWSGDLRVKMCIQPSEEDFVTIHHELGHDFYFQRYFTLPILFQQGANDGFHEAIGDAMALSVTPEYLATLGLASGPSGTALPPSEHARINQLMQMALSKVAFLPFGLLIDTWRWGVFSGKIPPAEYNASYWKLRERVQGVSAPSPRTEADFDPGAKFHVASSTPYMRYFLARIYQFQLHRALCAAAGLKGPLSACSIHGNKAAGDKLMAMLSLGASRPWPDALDAASAGKKADASALLEYFAPLAAFLADANKGKTCGF